MSSVPLSSRAIDTQFLAKNSVRSGLGFLSRTRRGNAGPVRRHCGRQAPFPVRTDSRKVAGPSTALPAACVPLARAACVVAGERLPIPAAVRTPFPVGFCPTHAGRPYGWARSPCRRRCARSLPLQAAPDTGQKPRFDQTLATPNTSYNTSCPDRQRTDYRSRRPDGNCTQRSRLRVVANR